ncbi:MAG TPA: hypothetical protein VNM47_01160 [Terriglobia bacterium]|nr:hypothetical protein [Terriglobia bacterium]
MIECIFTIDYEIYGDGTGSLKDLVHDPGVELANIFRNWDVPLVVFVEAAELEKIEEFGADPAIDLVKRQIREFYRDGFEIGLHLHPQWCNASHDRGTWRLDYSEYNLCTLPSSRIRQIVDRSCAFLQHLVDQGSFAPLSYRAGNWLFQPTQAAASILAEKGMRIDSSVFKGGVIHQYHLDYRPALRNGYFWRFSCDVNKPDPLGPWIELPVHTEMVHFWEMLTVKRMSFSRGSGASSRSVRKRLAKILDRTRFRYPLKLDFCRMTINELVTMVETVIREDRDDPDLCRPIVAIGHTKDLTDPQTVNLFLSFLQGKGIKVSTFKDVYPRLLIEEKEAVETHC